MARNVPMESPNLRRPRSLRECAPARPGTLALALSAAMLAPLPALGQAAKPDGQSKAPTELPGVKVQATAIDPNPNAEPGVPYKATTSGDERHTRPLAETPQTITVITRTAIEDSGDTDLRAHPRRPARHHHRHRRERQRRSATATSSAARKRAATSSWTACAIRA